MHIVVATYCTIKLYKFTNLNTAQYWHLDNNRSVLTSRSGTTAISLRNRRDSAFWSADIGRYRQYLPFSEIAIVDLCVLGSIWISILDPKLLTFLLPRLLDKNLVIAESQKAPLRLGLALSRRR